MSNIDTTKGSKYSLELPASLVRYYSHAQWQVFLQTELGQLYQAIPFQGLATVFKPHLPKHPQGAKSRFTVEGALGLMFLKPYLGLSDKKLKERLNCDWQLQLFCGIYIAFDKPIRDNDIVGRWRRFFALHMDIEQFQAVLIAHWKPFMQQAHVLMNDATVYESAIKYPTDVKLLWDCSEWLFNHIGVCCKHAGIKPPRSKYKLQKGKQQNYMKQRRKTHKQERRRRRALLYWVQRGIDLLQALLQQVPSLQEHLASDFYQQLRLVKTIYAQQQYHFHHPKASIADRVVSLYKPYIRPIVRGKENKRVEFGAKVHISQVDHLNFIEHISFNPFHEGRRMGIAIYKQEQHFGRCHQYEADQLYASNKNRKHCTQKAIYTGFKRKGKAGKYEDQAMVLRKCLNAARASRLEGSFGNEKNHYTLAHIKARTPSTEIAWICFGIHTANAMKVGRRIARQNETLIRQAA